MSHSTFKFQLTQGHGPEIDPKGFLSNIKGSCIIDEVQKLPPLLSYIQGILDNKADHRRFVLTGSNSLLLSEKISQSLAGRSRLLYVLPLERAEIPAQQRPQSIEEALFFGGYPRIFDEGLAPNQWLGDYYQTYVEKDVRSLTQIENLSQFDRFVRLVAGRCGQLANYSSLATDVGISSPTARNWLSILEASFVAYTLQPHFRNFSKRLIKTSKIYFYDTGLLCYLLRINSTQQLQTHPLRGAIFENWVINELIKRCHNAGESPPYYFWRDQHGHEVDLVADRSTVLDLMEIKSSQTFHQSFFENLDWLNELQESRGQCSVIYGGDDSFDVANHNVRSWRRIFED